MKFNLNNRLILITGASSGIGRACAIEFSRKGAHVALIGRNKNYLNEVEKIIFADEPTANLDSVSGKQVIDLLTELHRSHQHTIVMVTHEREYATNCTRIVDMEDGRIVSDVPN